MAERVAEKHTVNSANDRSYELDFLKLIFTFLVVIRHTSVFINENTRIHLPNGLGVWSVHFFFIVSGMLMANSIMKVEKTDTPGKDALSFIKQKFSYIAPQYWTAMFLAFITVLVIYVIKGLRVMELFERIVPELFLVTFSGTDMLFVNPQTWYLSAMFIGMFPLCYMMLKNRDFFVNVFAPLFGIMSYGYIYYTLPDPNVSSTYWTGFIFHGLLRALCFLCLGVTAYSMAVKFREHFTIKKKRIILTILEATLYIWIFIVWFKPSQSTKSLFSVMLLLPIAVAITFSGRSYISELFKAKWMKYLAPLSLMIYLNHFAGRKIVQYLMPGLSYKVSVSLMLGFTVGFCILYAVILKVCQHVREKS